LIALIINAHPLGADRPIVALNLSVLGEQFERWTLIRKTSLSSDRSDGNCGQAMPTLATMRSRRVAAFGHARFDHDRCSE
jgi:hypothetical protein